MAVYAATQRHMPRRARKRILNFSGAQLNDVCVLPNLRKDDHSMSDALIPVIKNYILFHLSRELSSKQRLFKC